MAVGRTRMIDLPAWGGGRAACAGHGSQWDSMSSGLDHAYSHQTLWERTQYAIPFCSRCPIQADCYRIAEADGYTGVAGGHIFKEGKPITPLRVVSQSSATMSA